MIEWSPLFSGCVLLREGAVSWSKLPSVFPPMICLFRLVRVLPADCVLLQETVGAVWMKNVWNESPGLLSQAVRISKFKSVFKVEHVLYFPYAPEIL